MNAQRAIRLTALLDGKRKGERIAADVMVEAKTVKAMAIPPSVMRDMRSGDASRACAQVLDLALDGIRHASRRDEEGGLDGTVLKPILLDAAKGVGAVLIDAFRSGIAGRGREEWEKFSRDAMEEVLGGAEGPLFLHGEDRVEVSKLAAPEIRMIRAAWEIAEKWAIEGMGADAR